MSEWQTVRLGSVTEQRKEVVVLQPNTEYTTMGVRWYGKGAYDRGKVTTETVKAKRLYRAREGDFVFNRIDTQKGAFDVVPPALDGALATNEFPLYVADPGRLLAPFLLLYFQQQSVMEAIDRVRSGSEGRSRWKEANFEAWSAPLPPLTEQRRIVDVMAAVEAQIEALGRELDAATLALDRVRGALPGSVEVPMGELLSAIESGKSRIADGDHRAAGKSSILKLSAVQRGYFDPSEAKWIEDPSDLPSHALVSEGDLLITRSNTPDRVGFSSLATGVPEGTYMPDLMWRLRVDPAKVRPAFLHHGLASSQVRAKVTATATGTSSSMRKLSKRNFKQVEIPVPSLAEQGDYVQQCDALQHVGESTRAELDRLRMFRSALLSSLLNQEIEVPESYDELLEAAS